MSKQLEPCPCGAVPTRILCNCLHRSCSGQSPNIYSIYGDCCANRRSRWAVEKHSKILLPHPSEVNRWWNSAPRGEE